MPMMLAIVTTTALFFLAIMATWKVIIIIHNRFFLLVIWNHHWFSKRGRFLPSVRKESFSDIYISSSLGIPGSKAFNVQKEAREFTPNVRLTSASVRSRSNFPETTPALLIITSRGGASF
tara:strand:- start:209 stop:568 length:360 start_codon:yes stop_codon:yes gene_type:complete